MLFPMVAASILVLAGHAMPQTPANTTPPFPSPQSPPVPAVSKEVLEELGTFINLGQGTMFTAAESLEEQYFEKFAKTGLEDYRMPKLIYGPGAAEAKIESDLKLSLYNMRALDALALVAAAAGCRLEPIPSLPDSVEDNKKPQQVIGYYVTVAMRPTVTQTPAFTPVFRDVPRNTAGILGLVVGEQNGDVLIRDVLPGLPAAESKSIAPGEKLLSIAEEGGTELKAAEVGPEKVSELLVGEPGSKVRITLAPPNGAGQPKVVHLTRQLPQSMVATPTPPLVRWVEPVVDTFAYHNINREALPNTFANLPPGMVPTTANAGGYITNFAPTSPPAPVAPAGQFVRIYPMGFYIKENENDEQHAKKHVSLEQLVKSTLEQAKLEDKEDPVLSLHSATKVLIVRATAAQHELIQQIITSLKENQQSEAQGTGTPPR